MDGNLAMTNDRDFLDELMNWERWRDIKGYEGLYRVSSFGRVKSLDKYIRGKGDSKRFLKGRILKLSDDGNGYLKCTLQKDCKIKTIKVHRLVADAFLGNTKDNGLVVDHIDDNKQNNHMLNLRLVTQSENTLKGKRGKGSSKYDGVCYCKRYKIWKARFTHNKKAVNVGNFKTEYEAHKALEKAKKDTINRL